MISSTPRPKSDEELNSIKTQFFESESYVKLLKDKTSKFLLSMEPLNLTPLQETKIKNIVEDSIKKIDDLKAQLCAVQYGYFIEKPEEITKDTIYLIAEAQKEKSQFLIEEIAKLIEIRDNQIKIHLGVMFEKCKENYISLFKNIVAGDYYFLKIKDSGEAEFTNYNYQQKIRTHKRGKLSEEEVNLLFVTLKDKGFFEFEDKYDVYPLKPGDEDLVYEDIYFRLEVCEEKPKVVLTHVWAAPSQLKEIIKLLSEIESKLPDSELFGYFLQATVPDILSNVRLEILEISRAEEEELKEYPFFEKAILNLGDFIHITPQQASKIKKHLTKEGILKIKFDQKELLIGMFERERDLENE